MTMAFILEAESETFTIIAFWFSRKICFTYILSNETIIVCEKAWNYFLIICESK